VSYNTGPDSVSLELWQAKKNTHTHTHTHAVQLSGLALMWREGSGLDLVRPTMKQKNAGMLIHFPTDPARMDVTNDDLKARRRPIKQATFLKFLPFLF